jgi:hypothetical protein
MAYPEGERFVAFADVVSRRSAPKTSPKVKFHVLQPEMVLN